MDIETMVKELDEAHTAAIKADNDYRVARANKYLEMAIPADGSKKPSDEIIKAKLDCDPILSTMHKMMDESAALLSITQYKYRAMISLASAEDKV